MNLNFNLHNIILKVHHFCLTLMYNNHFSIPANKLNTTPPRNYVTVVQMNTFDQHYLRIDLLSVPINIAYLSLTVCHLNTEKNLQISTVVYFVVAEEQRRKSSELNSMNYDSIISFLNCKRIKKLFCMISFMQHKN